MTIHTYSFEKCFLTKLNAPPKRTRLCPSHYDGARSYQQQWIIFKRGEVRGARFKWVGIKGGWGGQSYIGLCKKSLWRRKDGWDPLHIESGRGRGRGQAGVTARREKSDTKFMVCQSGFSVLSLIKTSFIYPGALSSGHFVLMLTSLHLLSSAPSPYYLTRAEVWAHSARRGQRCNCLAASPNASSASACQVTRDEGRVPWWVVKSVARFFPALDLSTWWVQGVAFRVI